MPCGRGEKMTDENKSPVEAFFAKFNFRGAIVPLIFLVVGILFIVFPESSLNVICYVLGALMLVAGVVRLGFAIFRPTGSRFADLIFAGVIIVVGILLLAAQSTVVDFVTVVLGIVLIIDAVLKIEENVALRKLNPVRWCIILAVAAVCIALGVAVVALSFAETVSVSDILMIVVGISMLFDAVYSIAILVYSALKEVKGERAVNVIDIDDDDDDDDDGDADDYDEDYDGEDYEDDDETDEDDDGESV